MINVFFYWAMDFTLRFFQFDASRMKTRASIPFEKCVLSVCGISDGAKPNGLLSSLPSELAFNSLRDVARRHSKKEKTTPSGIHSVCWKSSCKHSFGCSPVNLTDSDWAVPLKKGQVKKAVFENHRATDKQLGISADGLTKNRQNKAYTKPHIFSNRLHLLSALSNAFKEIPGADVADRRDAILNLYENLWISKVCPELWFCRYSREEMNDVPDQSLLVCRSGPFSVGCLNVKKVDGHDKFKIDSTTPFTYVLVDSLEKLQFAMAKPSLLEDGSLSWAFSGAWLSLVDWIADFGILSISAALLTAVCGKMKLKTGRLDHRLRVEYFLKHLGRSDEWVKEVLANLVIKERKKKEKTEDEEDRK